MPLDPELSSGLASSARSAQTPTEWVVISGPTSSGKSTLFNALRRILPQYLFLPEAAARLIEQDKKQGVIPTWTREYSRGLSHRIIELRRQEEEALRPDQLVMMDRGIPDVRAFAANDAEAIDYIVAAERHLYKQVFMMDLLDDFTHDGIRYENYDFAKKMAKLLPRAYQDAGYKPIMVAQFPFGKGRYESFEQSKADSVAQRVKFILERL